MFEFTPPHSTPNYEAGVIQVFVNHCNHSLKISKYNKTLSQGLHQKELNGGQYRAAAPYHHDGYSWLAWQVQN